MAIVTANVRHRDHDFQNHFESLGIKLHHASSLSQARQRLRDRPYSLILINPNNFDESVLDLYPLIHSKNTDVLILTLKSHPVQPSTQDGKCSKLSFPEIRGIVKLTGGVILDFNKMTIRVKGATRRLRGSTPIKLLTYFLANPDRIISKHELYDFVWADSCCSSPDDQGNAINVTLATLRKIIEPDPKNPRFIVNIRGKGWIMPAEVIVSMNHEIKK